MEPTVRLARWLPMLALVVWIAASFCLQSFTIAASQQQIITAEEASSAFVNVVFFENRLQHHRFGTNIVAYAIFSLGHRAFPDAGLFYARFIKAWWMGLAPALLLLYARHRLALPLPYALFAAMLLLLIPGFLALGWTGVDMGMDTVFGLLALLLASDDSPWVRLAAALVASLAALTYGSGICYLLPVAYELYRRSTSRRWLVAALAAMALPVGLSIWWWTNVQMLIAGGGNPTISLAAANLWSLMQETAWRSDSYYFFAGGRPALGHVTLVLAGLAGLWIGRHHRAVLLLVASNIGLYAFTGGVIGVRRTLPLQIGLLLGIALFAHHVATRWPQWRGSLVAAGGAALVLLSISAVNLHAELADGRIALPRDFALAPLPGQSQAASLNELAQRRQVPRTGDEPDRTGAILYLLSGRRAPTIDALIKATDQHGWSIGSHTARFVWLRRR